MIPTAQGRIQDLKLGVVQRWRKWIGKFETPRGMYEYIPNTIIIVYIYIYIYISNTIVIVYVFQIRYISNTMFYYNIVYLLSPLIQYCNKNCIWKKLSGGPVRPL